MKWIKSREKFLSEANIGDVILPTQKEAVKALWGERILDLEEIEATDNIIQGKWKLSEEDKIQALSTFFKARLDLVYEFFGRLPNEFKHCLEQSIDLDLIKNDNDKFRKILNNFDVHKPSINQISVLSESIFKKISMSETQADEIMIRDENGRPILDEETKKPIKRKREKDEIIFSKNLVNINGFVEDYNRLYPDKTVDAFKFSSGEVLKVISASKEDFGGDNYLVEVDVYARDMFLSIKHNAKDILNMSVSRFYGSCQHLYRGGYRTQVIGNVFDPNSVPAFLIFDSPILDSKGVLISEQLPLSRMMIRNIDLPQSKDDDKFKLYFDRAYPDRMEDFMSDIIEKHTGMKPSDTNDYVFSPDVPEDIYIGDPYMDRLGIKRKKLIGINAKSVTFSQDSDWSKCIISPKARIEEINIDTTMLPQNFFDLKLDPKVTRFRYLKLNSLDPFKNLKSNTFSFDKCQFKNEILSDLNQNCPNIKSLEFINCELEGKDISVFKNLEELHLIYTVDFIEFKGIVEGLKLKKIVISGDLASGKENKNYINSLKSKGIKIETIGPVI
jgi:hypothetical protein